MQFNDSENEDEDDALADLGKREEDEEETGEKEVKFTDEGTTAMFGGEVSVTVDSNIAEQLDEASHMFSGKIVNSQPKFLANIFYFSVCHHCCP